MTFEEFFKKKRIDTAALEVAEAGLFSEFKTHFDQMGEKSFDHTKKYWFNKLRRQFPLAPEVKAERPHIANPLAEQTITESLSETVPVASPAPKLGFVPKFKAANMPKSAVDAEKKEETPSISESLSEAAPVAAPSPKLGFTPKFKAANMPKPVIDLEKNEDKSAATESDKAEKPEETTAPKPAYKPRFNMKNIPPKE